MPKGGARSGTGRKKGESGDNYRKNKRVSKYSFTFKPFLIWLINKGIKKSVFARVNLGIDDSLFTHWLKSQDPPISTFLKIIEGSDGELRIEDFIVDNRFKEEGGKREGSKDENVNIDIDVDIDTDIDMF